MTPANTKISYRRLQEFSAAARSRISRFPNDKLSYALGRILATLTPIDNKMQDHLNTINVEYALTDPPDDPNGRLLRNGDNYEYTKAGAARRDKAITELLDKGCWEVQSHLVLSIPKGLTPSELQLFSGLVFKPEDVERTMEIYENGLDSEIGSGPQYVQTTQEKEHLQNVELQSEQ